MTRKHFKALADALSIIRPERGDDGYDAWESCVATVVDVCADVNPLFNRQKFWAACDPEHEPYRERSKKKAGPRS